MTEDNKQLLAVFESRIRSLIALCEKQEQRINELKALVSTKEDEVQQAMIRVNEMKARYDNMLTARIVSVNSDEVKSAKSRLSKLVREVDKCIALLNE